MPVHAKIAGPSPSEAIKAVKRNRGRPANTGAPQKRMMIEDIAGYRSLKARSAPQSDITAIINSETRKIIQHFGWTDPLRAVSPVTVVEADSQDEHEQKRRDAVFKKVRAEVRKVWRENLLAAPSHTADKSSVQIAELIKLFARKPRRKQLYKVWATSQARPDLEAEVDKRHAVKMQQSASNTRHIPRVATWNEVASEWFHLASKREKKAARKQSKRAYRQDKKGWELGASATPDSPDEAIEFMEASQTFLSDLMHFFASRASGIAVMFLSGPNGASLMWVLALSHCTLRSYTISSEGVCNVPERPKLLYTEVNPDDCTHFKYALAKQTQILNADKNSDDDVEGEEVEVEGGRIEGGEVEGEEVEEEGVNDGDGDADEDIADDDDGVEGTDKVEFLLYPPLMSGNQQGAQETHSRNHSDPDAYEGSLSVHSNAETSADEPIFVDNPYPFDITCGIFPAQRAGMATYFAFDVEKHYTRSIADTAEYARVFRVAVSKILPRKPWLEESNTVNFLRSVPKKLQDRIDVQLACDLSMAYLSFEASGLDEFPLDVKAMKTSDGSAITQLPSYVAGLQSRSFASRWNNRADKGISRTPAQLDADIDVTLPHQWALLQPKERLDDQERIVHAANASMTWKKALAPGIDGVRLLVVTALVWAWNIGEEEHTQWSYLAIDMIQVLRILCHQATLQEAYSSERVTGQAESCIPEGRKKSARKWKKSAKLRESERSG
ncbi:unnamed protein product [Peniophora sp. CBMAI 1063]|nr:unnamed protein product [Peniophora sp. CBMAI 1063]